MSEDTEKTGTESSGEEQGLGRDTAPGEQEPQGDPGNATTSDEGTAEQNQSVETPEPDEASEEFAEPEGAEESDTEGQDEQDKSSEGSEG